jgi:hypothetical protein
MGLSKVTGPNKSTGFYISPQAENKVVTTYKGQGKDTCKVIRIKSNVDETTLDYIKDHKAPPHGLGGSYHHKIWKST